MEMKQNFSQSKYFYAIIYIVSYVTAKQLIRFYNKELLPPIDIALDGIIFVLVFFVSTFKVNDKTKGTYSTLSEPFRISIFVIGIGLLLLKTYLSLENMVWFKNQMPAINTIIFGLISFNYFHVIDTDEKRKKLTNFLKYLFGFIAMANLSTLIF